MVRKVFFSFHYKRDVWRVNQVRNSWVTKEDIEDAGYIDASEFEKIEKQGENVVKRWINEQLEGTSVTVVLIGAETSERYYVQYEINQSWSKGNGLIGIYIHNLKDQNGNIDYKGLDPFIKLGYKGIRTYDWVNDDGYNNISEWIELAYQRAQNRKE